MYYLDDELSLRESVDIPVYRVFGGDSELEGSYVTNINPANPISARCELSLSQHDFLDMDGKPVRNTASEVASGHISVDDEGHIINNTICEATSDILEFTEVQPTSDMPGGGMEYHLQGNFNDLVQVDSVDDLRHKPTQGWLDYLEAEDKILYGNDGNTDPETGVNDIDPNHADINGLIDEEEYHLQSDDTHNYWESYIGESVEDSDDIDTVSLDDLIDEEEYHLQSDDTHNYWGSYIGDSVEDSDDINTDSLDDLIDEEEYYLQSDDTQNFWESYIDNYGNDDNTLEPADINCLIEDEEYYLQLEDVENSWESSFDDCNEDDSWDDCCEDDSWDDCCEDDSWDDCCEDDSWDNGDDDN